MKAILALDLGSHTGFAVEAGGCPLACGTWELVSEKNLRHTRKLRMNRRLDPRIPALWHRINSLHESLQLDWIVWEDVLFQSSTAQTQLWSSFRTVCWLFGHLRGVGLECLPVGSLKKFATGNGAADKNAMARALVRQDSRFKLDSRGVIDTLTGGVLDDNACDAIHLLSWAKTILK